MSNPLLSNTISEKLTKANYVVWKAQILAVLRGAHLEGYLMTSTIRAPQEKIKGKEEVISNPVYEEWYTIDQQVLAYLLLSLSREIMGQVTIYTTSASAWSVIEGMYTSGTCAHSVNTCIALATMKKGSDSITEYINKACILADEMALTGKKIDDEELISYIFIGLDFEYYSVVSALVVRSGTLSIGEVYSQLLSYEQRIK
jgi:hypothetical protein